MAASHCVAIDEATALLEKLSDEDRDHILCRLVRAKLEGEPPHAKVPVYGPQGALIGYIQVADRTLGRGC